MTPKGAAAGLWDLTPDEAQQLLDWANAILRLVTEKHPTTDLLKAMRDRLRAGGNIISEKQRALVSEVTMGDETMDWLTPRA